MKMKHILFSIILAITFAVVTGCGAVQSFNSKVAADVNDIVAPIKQTTVDDAKAALVIATTRGDTDAAPCYQDIIDFLSQPGTGVPEINGVLSALEAARTFQGIQVPPKLHKDCAVPVIDAQRVALRLGLRVGEVATGAKVASGAAALKSAEAALAAGHP